MSAMKDKVAVITGSSSGIGAQTALEFARLGCCVVLTARRREELEHVAQRCQDAGLPADKVLILPGDLLDDDHVRNIVKATVERFGGIDILVNNAGLAKTASIETATVDDFDLMYRINTRYVFLIIKEALPYLKERKGSVVNVSSIASLRPLPYVLPYTVAKAAQDQLTRTLALDLAPKGVRVNAICPGTFRTEIFERSGYLKPGETLDDRMETMAKLHPMGRVGNVEEAAKAIVFLASPDSSYISGAILPVDGARHTTSWLPGNN